MGLKVLSLFDGVSVGLQALKESGIEVEVYYASEIDEDCVKISKKNHPEIIHLGDVEGWRDWDLGDIDLLIGGSPCQGFSSQGKQLNFEDPRSRLFFCFVDILQHYRPRHFMLENVVMPKQEWEDTISRLLGVIPVLIDSALVSAQSRKRLYWANFPINQPEHTGVSLSDIVEDGEEWFPASVRGRKINPLTNRRDDFNEDLPYEQYLQSIDSQKALCLTTVQKDSLLTKMPQGLYKQSDVSDSCRNFTITEIERLQGLPDGYTEGVSDSARIACIGNAWTVGVISHIFKNMDGKVEWL